MGSKKKKNLTGNIKTHQKTDAASKRPVDRRSVVQISDRAESKIKNLLKNAVTAEFVHQELSLVLTKKKAAHRLLSLYHQLSDYGFLKEQVQDAIKHLPKRCVSLDIALDWLMLMLPAESLPKSFTNYNGVFSTKNIIEVVKAAHPTLQKSEVKSETELTPSKLLPSQEKKAKDNTQNVNKQWIMQYMETVSDEDEEKASNSDKVSVGVDEWDVWSDPREVFRRKNERKNKNMKDMERTQLVTLEIQKVVEEASAAKKARDHEKQKKTGLMIKELKSELSSIESKQGSKLLPGFQQKENKSEKIEKESSDDDFMFGEDFFHIEANEQPVVSKQLHIKNEEFCDLREVMFQEESLKDKVQEEASIFEHPPKTEIHLDRTISYLSHSDNSYMLSLEKWRKSKTPIKLENHRLPKFLLLQNCQKMNYSNPRFDRIKGTAFDQSVTVTINSQVKKKKKNIAAEAEAQSFVFPFEFYPESIEEAQNCVAIVALMKLFPQLRLDLILQQPYKDVYLQVQQHKEELDNTDELEIEEFVEHAIAELGFDEEEEEERGENSVQFLTEQKLKGQILTGSDKSERKWKFLLKDASLDKKLFGDLQRFWASDIGQKWLSERTSLPVFSIKSEFLDVCKRRSLLLVSGDTGCGKTTQIPQFLYEDAVVNGSGSTCNILVTQPRRIAAISVARRVAEEMGQPRPSAKEDSFSLVGYHVRLDAAISKQTKITFCTTGILLRILSGDKLLSRYSHVIIDEVHERTVHSDFLVAVLKELVVIREGMNQPLKVILMSATMDSDLFAEYLSCPHLKTEGRTFPVSVKFLEDIYEQLQYRLDPESRAAIFERNVKNTLKASIKNKTSSKFGKNVIEENWGDESGSSNDILNQNYNPELYHGFSPLVHQNLKRLNEGQIDYDLLEVLVTQIDIQEPDGAILVFLPGLYEINQLFDRLIENGHFSREWIIRLHSSLTPEEQSRAFSIPPLCSKDTTIGPSSAWTLGDFIQEALPEEDNNKKGEIETVCTRHIRKVVIATNIAETSLTISDVVFVIDSGRFRERRYDTVKGLSALVEDWISKASVKQRKGRAGRVCEGVCYSLFTKHRFERQMDAYQVPEIKRIPLEETVLQIHSLNLGKSGDFLETLPQPPQKQAIEIAIKKLTEIGALETDVEVLTPLGKILATLPIDPQIGKLLVLASCFNCLSAALTIAAAFGERSIFITSPAVEESLIQIKQKFCFSGSKDLISMGQQSDHLLVVAVFHGWLQLIEKKQFQKARDYVSQNYLHGPTLEVISIPMPLDCQVRMQFRDILMEAKLITRSTAHSDITKNEPVMIRALLCASLYPNLCTLEQGSHSSGATITGDIYWSDGQNKVTLHKSSINAHLQPSDFQYPYFVYLEKIRTRNVTIRDCTVVSTVSLLLFSGSLHVHHSDNTIIIDKRIHIRAAAPIAVLFKKLRSAVDTLILQKIKNPEHSSAIENLLKDTIMCLLSDEELIRKQKF